jgi:hypothetical protein
VMSLKAGGRSSASAARNGFLRAIGRLSQPSGG